MSKLKPCPFCGNKAEVYEECELIKIRCSNYMCQASVNSWHDEVEDAIDAWNKRSADRPQGQWRKHDKERDYCSRCKHIFKTRTINKQDEWTNYIDDLGYNFCPNCGAKMRKK